LLQELLLFALAPLALLMSDACPVIRPPITGFYRRLITPAASQRVERHKFSQVYKDTNSIATSGLGDRTSEPTA
jgi:hypothetical protein